MVRARCRALGVSRSGYYAWRSRPKGDRARSNRCLVVEIRAVHEQSRRTYGSRRVHAELGSRGLRCSRNRVARLMQQAGIRAVARRKYRHTMDSRHDWPTAPNVLERNFRAEGPDRVWLTDITYVPTEEGWLYLGVVLDLCSRRVVGWALQERIDRRFAIRQEVKAAIVEYIETFYNCRRRHSALGYLSPAEYEVVRQ